jgi:tetratricopeptide (TPR) repeat protein
MKRRLAGAAALFAVIFLAYLPIWSAGFIWNDPDYVTRPALRSLHGLTLIWTRLGATEQYYPLLHSFFWVQHRLWGNAALGYHLVDVGLHALSAVLLVAALEQLWPQRRDAALLAGLLFALHPVMVESAAWISEQKNTLSLVFYLLSALSFERWRRRTQPLFYWLGLAAFVAALLSKTVTATLPAALLVIIWWRDGRVDFRRDVRPLLPWFALAVGWGLFSAWVERTYVGAQGTSFALSFGDRLLLAARIPWFYLGKLLWPAHLVFIYPRWTISAHDPVAWLYVMATLAAAIVLWWSANPRLRPGLGGQAGRAARLRPNRGATACACFFLGSLFPTLGFFNVYAFLYSYVADHWDYLPALGVFAGAAYLLCMVSQRWPAALRLSGAAVLLGALAVRTNLESRTYEDAGRFYLTIITRNPSAWMAQHNLGDLFAQRGQDERALGFYRAALRARPDLPLTEYGCGQALERLKRPEEAQAHFRTALQYDPKFVSAHVALGRSLLADNHPAEAAAEFAAVDQINPAYPQLTALWVEALNNAGAAALQSGDPASAQTRLAQALKLDPDYAMAWANLGRAMAASGQAEAAIMPLQQALQLQPNFPEAENDLGAVYALAGRTAEAIAHYERALQLRPGYPDAERNLQLARAAAH